MTAAPPSTHSSYPLLGSAFELGGLRLRNRTVMSPMSSCLGNDDGSVSPRQVEFYRERAKGGVGMVIVEFTGVDRRLGLAETNQLSLDGPGNLPGHKVLVDAIRSAGARAALQLHAPGRHADRRTISGLPAGPSDEYSKRDGRQTARALTPDEIRELIDCFARSARLALVAGYEAIELHAAHGYLPMAFLSPLANRRDDEWGGDFDRRLRFAEAVVRAVRDATGGAVPLLYRLSASEHLPGGLTIDDMKNVVPRLVAAGVDCFDVSTGSIAGSLDMAVDLMSMPEGWRFGEARAIRAASGVPVIGIGPVRWPETAEHALAAGDADLICLGRPLLADPEWPSKVLRGERDAITPCTNCNWCFSRVVQHGSIGCAERPQTGAELEQPVEDMGTAQRRLVVIGGGPGGMSAALEAARRGWETTLYEARDELGGGLISSAAPPLKDKLLWYLDHLRRAVGNSAITVELARAPTLGEIAAAGPDLVIVATGAQPLPLGFEATHEGRFSAYDVLMGDVVLPTAGTAVVYGGGETGCETAEYLAERGLQVTLVTRSGASDLARSAEPMYRKHLLHRLRANGAISILENSEIERFDEGTVSLHRQQVGSEKLGADALVVAQGRTTGSPLVQPLEELGMRVEVLGDAAQIGRIGDAVHAAHAVIEAYASRLLQRQ